MCTIFLWRKISTCLHSVQWLICICMPYEVNYIHNVLFAVTIIVIGVQIWAYVTTNNANPVYNKKQKVLSVSLWILYRLIQIWSFDLSLWVSLVLCQLSSLSCCMSFIGFFILCFPCLVILWHILLNWFSLPQLLMLCHIPGTVQLITIQQYLYCLVFSICRVPVCHSMYCSGHALCFILPIMPNSLMSFRLSSMDFWYLWGSLHFAYNRTCSLVASLVFFMVVSLLFSPALLGYLYHL